MDFMVPIKDKSMFHKLLKRRKYLKAMQMVRYITIVEILDIHLAVYHPEHVCRRILRDFITSKNTFFECLPSIDRNRIWFYHQFLDNEYMEQELLTIKKNTGVMVFEVMTFKTMMSLKENRTFFMRRRVVEMIQKPTHCYSAYFKDNYLDLFNSYFKL
jgi:hypothetical protein